jgi:type I restriction enzyme S subunit
MGVDVPVEHDRSWPVVSLAEITTKIGSGATPRGGSDAYLPSRTNFALVRSQNVFDRRFDRAGLAFISDEQADGLRNVVLKPDDILLNITGDGVTFGRACIVPTEVLPACVNQHVSIIRLDPERAHAGYVLAFLTHPNVKQYIESFNAGGSRRAITKGHIESFRLPLPPLPVQQAMAHILGTLDDKIELNHRMNEALEAMARAIFKDWFVDFGPTRAKMEGCAPYLAPDIWTLFPDRLDVEGKPEGWGEVKIEDLLELAYGKSLPATDRREGPIPVYGSGGLTGFHDQPLVDAPVIILGRKGTVGSLYWEHRSCYPIDTVFYVRSQFPLVYSFHLLETLGLTDMNTDAAVPGLNRANVYRLLVPKAPIALVNAFAGQASTIRAKIVANLIEEETLAATRDLLLPKLMSGEMQLRDAEKALEAVA